MSKKILCKLGLHKYELVRGGIMKIGGFLLNTEIKKCKCCGYIKEIR
jgi:hypothetical protein